MRTPHRPLFVTIGVALGSAFAAIVAACGGGSGATDDSGSVREPSTEEAPAIVCDGDANAVGLGEGRVCADSGFRPAADDFSFPNWAGVEDADGGDGLTVDSLVRLYGAADVCTDGIADPCIPTPVATQTLEQWSGALAGGRCEGMAALSVRYFLGLDDPGVEATTALSRPNPTLEQDINFWWATQFVDEVKSAAAESRTKDPVTLTEELIVGLASGAGFTVGIYGNGFGHAVTPYAVTETNGGYSIFIYDNNAPGEERTIAIDRSANTWTYELAAQNPDGSAMPWSGSTGTFELTPMGSRSAPFACSFCDQGSSAGSTSTKGVVTVTLAAGGRPGDPAAGLLISTVDGRRIGVDQGVLVNEVAGAVYTVGKGGLGTSLVSVEVPANSDEYSVQVVSATSESFDDEIDTVVSVGSPNGSLTTVRARRPLKPGAPLPPGAGAPIDIDADAGVGVLNDSNSESTVAVATSRDRVEVAVPPRGRAENRDASGSARVTASDAAGTPIVERDIEVKKFEKLPPGGVPSTTRPRGESPPGSTVGGASTSGSGGGSGTGSSVPRSSTSVTGGSSSVPRSSSTAVTGGGSSVPRSSTTIGGGTGSSIARSSSTTVVRSSTTVARSSTTVPTNTTVAPPTQSTEPATSSSTSSVPRSSTTVPRSSTSVARSSTTTTSP